jgi:uncharacterized DUF497 family protein
MKITFDPGKDIRNRAKHGISLAEAVSFDWLSTVEWEDERVQYGEKRMCALGWLGKRIYFVLFVDREHERRVISLRKANKRELREYEKQRWEQASRSKDAVSKDRR